MCSRRLQCQVVSERPTRRQDSSEESVPMNHIMMITHPIERSVVLHMPPLKDL